MSNKDYNFEEEMKKNAEKKKKLEKERQKANKDVKRDYRLK